MTDEIRLIALTDVAKILNCSISHVRALADRGELPAVRDTNNRRAFFESDVQRFKAKREQTDTRKLRLRFKD